MNASTRTALKQAIDQHYRPLVLPRPGDPAGCCVGCGGDYSSNTIGCERCHDRHRRRAPEQRAKQSAWSRERRKSDSAFRARRREIEKASQRARREKAAA